MPPAAPARGRTIAETNEVLRLFADGQIRAEEARFSDRLRRTQESLPRIQSIWAFDGNRRPLVSSTVLPVPRELNNSDRDYFRAQVENDAGKQRLVRTLQRMMRNSLTRTSCKAVTILRAATDRGTRCSRGVFMRAAGTVHTPAARSISSQMVGYRETLRLLR